MPFIKPVEISSVKAQDNKSGAALLREYIQTNPAEVKEALSRLLPESVIEIFDIDHWGWINNLTSIDGSSNPYARRSGNGSC